MATFRARFEGGHVTAKAGAALTGGTLVKVDSSAGNIQGGEYQVVPCGAGDRAFGVAEVDVTSGQIGQDANSVERRVGVVRKPCIARVKPGATITAGQDLQSDSLGRAIPLASAVAAHLDTGVVGSNNALTWTARTPGVAGNSITVTIVDPGGTTAALSVEVEENGLDIVVNLARASSAITTTADDLAEAIEAYGEANQLVSLAFKSTSDGTGLVAAVAKTNLAGGTDPEGGGHVIGQAVCNAGSSDDFVEVDLH